MIFFFNNLFYNFNFFEERFVIVGGGELKAGPESFIGKREGNGEEGNVVGGKRRQERLVQ